MGTSKLLVGVGIVALLMLGGCAEPPQGEEQVGTIDNWVVTDMGCAGEGVRLYVMSRMLGGNVMEWDANVVKDKTCEE